ncbi:MAG: BadF/BadG/BcrA/BcrD ATPase family protein, partial [Verrucomicrobiota bacterium]
MKARSGGTRVIGIECGGTRSVALAAEPGRHGSPVRIETGAANLRLVSDANLEAHFEDLRSRLPGPAAVGVGMAGVRTEEDRRRLRSVVARVWPGVPVRVDHDLVSALEAASLDASEPYDARMILLSGTGSCCFGRDLRGRTAKAGGWGHQLGDQGSGYAIGYAGLREAIAHLEHTGRTGPLARRLLKATGTADPEAWVAWLQAASKREVAALAPEVFAAAAAGDDRARAVVERCLGELVDLAGVCADRLDPTRRARLEFVLAGSVFL